MHLRYQRPIEERLWGYPEPFLFLVPPRGRIAEARGTTSQLYLVRSWANKSLSILASAQRRGLGRIGEDFTIRVEC